MPLLRNVRFGSESVVDEQNLSQSGPAVEFRTLVEYLDVQSYYEAFHPSRQDDGARC